MSGREDDRAELERFLTEEEKWERRPRRGRFGPNSQEVESLLQEIAELSEADVAVLGSGLVTDTGAHEKREAWGSIALAGYQAECREALDEVLAAFRKTIPAFFEPYGADPTHVMAWRTAMCALLAVFAGGLIPSDAADALSKGWCAFKQERWERRSGCGI